MWQHLGEGSVRLNELRRSFLIVIGVRIQQESAVARLQIRHQFLETKTKNKHRLDGPFLNLHFWRRILFVSASDLDD